MNAVLHAFAALETRDNPKRTAPPDHAEIGPALRRTFAEYSPVEQRRLVDHWLSTKKHGNDYAIDQLVEVDVNKLLLNFLAGDDAENGRMVANALLALGDQIDRDEEYWDGDL